MPKSRIDPAADGNGLRPSRSFVLGARILASGLALPIAFSSGCSSNRFQFANDRRAANDVGGLAAAPSGRGRWELGGAASQPGGPPPPAVLQPPAAAYQPPPVAVPPIAAAPVPVAPPTTRLLDPPVQGPELIGRVVDGYGRPEPRASIQVVDVANPGSIVAETASGADGVFRVSRLRSGAQYELSAFASSDGRRQAGRTFAVAPDNSVVIQVNRDSLPGGASQRRRELESPPQPQPQPLPYSASGQPGRLEVQTPAIIGQPIPAAPRPQFYVPPTDAPPSNDGGRKTIVHPTGFVPAFSGTPLERATVRLIDGGERDLSRLDGDLFLFDFFGSWCGPCRRCVPKVNEIHRRYGPIGLKVIGVACEHGERGEASQQAAAARNQLAVEYAVLVSPLDEPSTLRDHFQVEKYPTVALVDRKGKTLFQSSGGGEEVFHRLDKAIREALAKTPAR